MAVIPSILLLVLAPPTAGEQETATDAPPAKVSFQSVQSGKPPTRSYRVSLEIQNRHEAPRWFILRYWGDKPLPMKDEFSSWSLPKCPFGGREYADGGKRVAMIQHYGADKFVAFHLPGKARVEFDGYDIEAWDTIREFEIWEASAVRVNGKTALEKWLPYSTLSDDGAVIKTQADRKSADFKNLDFDFMRMRERNDHAKEVVESVTFSGIHRWSIPLKVKDPP